MEEVEDKRRSWWETRGFVPCRSSSRTNALRTFMFCPWDFWVILCAVLAWFVKVSRKSKLLFNPALFGSACLVHLETSKQMKLGTEVKPDEKPFNYFSLLENALWQETKVTKKSGNGFWDPLGSCSSGSKCRCHVRRKRVITSIVDPTLELNITGTFMFEHTLIL